MREQQQQARSVCESGGSSRTDRRVRPDTITAPVSAEITSIPGPLALPEGGSVEKKMSEGRTSIAR
jgi:hypothetical protein